LGAVLDRTYQPVSLGHLCAACEYTNIWIDSFVRVDPSNTMDSAATPDIDSAPEWQASVYGVNADAHLVAYDGYGGGTWQTVSNVVITATNFHRYTVKQDYVNKTWDLYFDGTNVLSDLGFRSTNVVEFSRFSLAGQWCGMTHIDDLYIGQAPPEGISE
jgi:hypothetical protein